MRKLICGLMVLAGACGVIAQTRPTMALYSTTNAAQREVAWSTEPGIRYVLQECTHLASNDWTTLEGFPSEASALAQQHLIELNAEGRFYRVQVLDEQPPEIVSRTPGDGTFGVRRFSTVTVELEDAGEIDTSSISLLLGSNSTYTAASSELSWSNNVLSLYLGGDIALGGWGETQTVALAVSDVLGNSTNYTWSFELEKQVEEADNLFVFGSPDARRAGQQLNGAAAVLAARYSTGPIRMSGTTEWEIDTVTSNEIVIVYTGADAPSFSAGQLLANLAPKHVSEIFYRRVDELSDDPGTKTLTLTTTEVTLGDVMVEGTFSLGEDAVFLDFDEDGNLIRTLEMDATFNLPSIGTDLTGKVLIDEGPLNLSLQEGKFLFHPKLKTSLDIGLSGVKRFEAEASGDLEISCVPLAVVSGSVSKSQSKELWTWSHWIGAGYVYVELKSTITANASISLETSAELKAGFRQTGNMGVSGRYVRDESPAATWNRWFDVDPLEQVKFTYTLNGEGNATVSLVPQIDARVYGAAGIYINTDPRIELSGSATFVDNELTEADWLLGAYADVNAGLSVIGYDTGELPHLPPFRLFTAEWGDQYSPEVIPLAITTQPFSQNARYGDTVRLSVEATGATAYQWYQNGSPLPGATGSKLTLRNVDSGDDGSFHVRVSGSGSSLNSASALLSLVTSGYTGAPVSGMVRIPGGTNSGTDAYSLTVSSFYMDRTEVTKAQWDTVYNWAVSHGYSFDNAGSGKAANHPVHTVSWYDCVKWCNARSQMSGRTPCYTVNGNVYKSGQSSPDCNFSANGYRLPTSDEWEYAARGGLSGRRFPWGDTINHSYANYRANGSAYSYDTSSYTDWTFHPSYDDGGYPYTSPAGSFSANGYGLYDMAGNVWEWCWDPSGSIRYFRGGSWVNYADYARCGDADWYPPGNADDGGGFRSVCR